MMLREYAKRRHGLMERLIEPARAAALVLQDLKMERMANGLNEVLFELDALTSQAAADMAADPEAVVRELEQATRDMRRTD